jgi:hypothetical protein
MKSVRRFTVFFIILVVSALTGCVGGEKTANSANRSGNSNANVNSDSLAAKDNIEDLETMIRLPFHPADAVWRDDPASGPEKPRKLTVILNFTADESNKIVEASAKGNPGTPFEIETESWFPPELIAKSQASGNETIKGKSYPATEFTQAPFTEGRVSRIDGTDFFVVELLAR